MTSPPIRVLQFICPTGFYGAERWVLALANNLDSNQVLCELAVTMEPGQANLQLVDAYQALGLPVHIIRTQGRFDTAAVSQVKALIKQRQIDIIHTHGYKSDILGLLAAKRANIKTVCTPHGFENTTDKKLRLFIWLGCQTFRFFNVIAPLSKALEQDVRRYGVKHKRCRYIQNGVDLKELMALARAQVQLNQAGAQQRQDVKIIGFVGQMISRKNIKDILDVFNQLCEERQDIHLQLLGDGEERAHLASYANTLTHADKIEFLGFRNDRIEHMLRFDLFVMSSSLEGIPRCLMEALALGIPTVAYDIAGVDQLIKHEQTGLLAPFGDTMALKQSWARILNDSALAERLSAAGRTFVNDAFSAARMAREYTELFNDLLGPKCVPGKAHET